MMRHKTNGKYGFTLIELLVVIAIIAVLAAILFPVFAAAKAKASETKCLANLKQIGLAFKMYASDYNDMLPNVWNRTYGWKNTPLTQQSIAALVSKLHPYIKSGDLWYCDADPWRKDRLAAADLNGDGDADWADGVVSYSYCIQWNSWYDGSNWVGDPICPNLDFFGGRFSGIQPTRQCLMIDNGLPSAPSLDVADYDAPHSSGAAANVVFWDTHAKLVRVEQFVDLHPPLLLQ